MPPPPPPRVASVFKSFPPPIRRKLVTLRRLIFKTAVATEGVGAITETLKWNEPAYLTEQSKSGSTIRLGWRKSAPHRCAMYFSCQTDLVSTFRGWFMDDLEFEGNRAIVFDEANTIPTAALAMCVEAALTYHLRKGRAPR